MFNLTGYIGLETSTHALKVQDDEIKILNPKKLAAIQDLQNAVQAELPLAAQRSVALAQCRTLGLL